jgi:hypothetical protein
MMMMLMQPLIQLFNKPWENPQHQPKTITLPVKIIATTKMPFPCPVSTQEHQPVLSAWKPLMWENAFHGRMFPRECSHVFHKGRIEHCLVDRKHDDCPSCRSMLLKTIISSSSSSPISGHDDDYNDNKGPKDENDADAGSSIFVIMHGPLLCMD